MFALASSEAGAQVAPVKFDLGETVKAVSVDAAAKPLGTTQWTITPAAAKPVAALASAAAAATPAVVRTAATATGQIAATLPAHTVTVSLAPVIAKEAAWLYKAGWPLYALVDRYSTGGTLDQEAQCMAVAVYHEARGETLEGQLAVARVIMNRAASGKYPSSWCGVVKQPWQFSFVNPRTGDIPYVNESSAAWRKAQAITRLAVSNVIPSVSSDVLWYHANYVAPSWGRRLTRARQIGTHIFYRT